MKRKAISSRKGRAPIAVEASASCAEHNACVPSPPRRIIVVDDHPMMRAGLAQLINQQPDLQVCCEAGHPAEAWAHLAHDCADLVITDITMPGRGGLEFIKDVKTHYPHLPVLVISMHDEMLYAGRTLRAGARGYIMKEAGAEKMLAGIRKVLAGDVFVSERMAAAIINAFSSHQPRGSHSPIEKLSDREFEIFELIGHGLTTKVIAKQLGLSPKTVDVHRAHIKEKLELGDVTSLVRHAVRWVEVQNPAM